MHTLRYLKQTSEEGYEMNDWVKEGTEFDNSKYTLSYRDYPHWRRRRPSVSALSVVCAIILILRNYYFKITLVTCIIPRAAINIIFRIEHNSCFNRFDPPTVRSPRGQPE